MNSLLPGHKVIAFDSSLYINDKTTPPNKTMKQATIIRRYGFISEFILNHFGREAAIYPDCCDIIFDHSNRESKGHFTETLKQLEL